MAAAAAIGAGGSLLSGIAAGKGAKKAAKIQAQAYRDGLAQQQAQFNVTQANEAPYIAAGNSALSGQLNLLGLNGNDAQGASIAALQASPGYTSVYDSGRDAILQSAAATGGLRGGNTQNSLAQFGSGLLAQLIQQQFANLGGLVTTGANSAAGLDQLSQNNANAQSSLIAQQGGAQATAAAAPYAAFASALNGVGQAAGQYFGSRAPSTSASDASIYYNSPTLRALGSGGSIF